MICGDGRVPKGDCRQQIFGKIHPCSSSAVTCVYQEVDPMALLLVFFLVERLIFPIVIPEEIINTLNIKNKYGDIKIKGLVLNEVSINNNVGDIDVNKSKFNTVLINNSVGNIDVDANINEALNITSIIGDVTLMINDSIDNYKSNVTKKIGSILVNGINYSKDVSLGSGEKNININSTIGGVSLNFKKEINKEN